MNHAISLTTIMFLLATGWPPVEVYAQEGWSRVRSSHFTLIGDAQIKEIDSVALRLEQFRASVLRLFDQNLQKPGRQITAIVFKNDAGFIPFKPLYRGSPSEVSGFFHSSDDKSYIVLSLGGRQSDPYRVILHEFAHLLITEIWQRQPTWLNEGLADYFSTFQPGKNAGEIETGLPIVEHARLLQKEKLIPLSTLISVDQGSAYYNDPLLKRLFYAQSWALVHYLLLGNEGKRASQLFNLMRNYSEKKTNEEQFKESFEASPSEIEAGFRQYIQRGAFTSVKTTFDRKVEFDQSIETSKAEPAEVLTNLGDLLWRMGRKEEARPYFKKLFEADTENEMAHTTLGILEYRDRNYAEARKHLEKSTALGSTNYLAWYYYSMALQWESSDGSLIISTLPAETEAKMRKALARAIELAPDFPDSYRQMAFINMINDTDLDQGVNLLRQAIALAPEREDFRYALAQIYLRKHDFSEAKIIAADLSKNAGMEEIRSNAIYLLESIEKTEELVKRMKLERVKSEEAAARTLPGRRFEGDQIRGTLIRIDCSDMGLTLTVRSGTRSFKFHAPAERSPVFVRYTTDVPNEIICGPSKSPQLVIITYRKSSDPRSRIEGEPIGVEFIR